MKIQALDIQVGDRIVAYCNDKRQACTVNQVLDPGQGSVTLKVFTSEPCRSPVSRVNGQVRALQSGQQEPLPPAALSS